MPGFFKNIISKITVNKKDEDNPEYRIKFAQRIANKKIRYISERVTDNKTGEVVDTIIGKNGFFNINKENYISVYCNGIELFKAFVPDLKAYEFMSLEGVVMESFDLVSQRYRQIIVYYIYHRR